jgi:putative membrane-bound dehydrogenase-like protein
MTTILEHNTSHFPARGIWNIFSICVLAVFAGVQFLLASTALGQGASNPHVVVVVGEGLYDTAETLPDFAAQDLEPRGFNTTFVYADSTNPNHFPGLDALNDADLLVLSVRRRALPTAQLDLIRQHLESGKPLVAVRTSSHAFSLRGESPPEGHATWEAFDREVLGARYEGHYDNREGTVVHMLPETEDHPLLNRVYQPSFRSGGTLYKSRELAASTEVVLRGEAVMEGDRVTEPVVWTNSYNGGHVFYTSLGHPADFARVSFRRLLTNAVFWGLGMEVPGMEAMAATLEVAEYMRRFEGRGELGGESSYTPPHEAVRRFEVPGGVSVDLAASEPDIYQPLYVTFGPRGRLWMVQYNQYPYPEGVKVTGYDYHLRAEYDAEPPPPPEGSRGADKITMLEDTNGDGVFDRAEDVISGLNIATSVAFGRGGIWVLAPPYLVKYPDTDGDGRPDGTPVVHLRGFGLQDTHSVANSLEWGPDGWLYGASGSTTIDTVSSAVTREVGYKGQAIWRYHPETEEFEIFAEGGGNTFNVEFDSKGRLYSGDNGGNSRGYHYKQGAYYEKNWGKHGALTNPYAFGYIDHMPHTGDEDRFTHAEIIYEGISLPERYKGTFISVNPLQSHVQVSDMRPAGSTFESVDTERLMVTDDNWFRPVDITDGPDGAVYIADWYDDRLTHVDPRDTWHRSSGRVYRIRGADHSSYQPEDLTRLSTGELIDRLSHPNDWQREEALRLIGDRQDRSAIPRLRSLIDDNEGQLALESLWALNLSGGFDEQWAPNGLAHSNPFVRMWTVRLLGDSRDVSSSIASHLADLAKTDSSPFVRSQLAASAKRLPSDDALPVIRQLMAGGQDVDDQQIPLQIWWALEAHAESGRVTILETFDDTALWGEPLVQEYILDRLMRRYIMAGGPENFETAARLLELAPSKRAIRQLMNGLQEGLRGTDLQISEMPSRLRQVLEQYQEQIGQSDLVLGVRQGSEEALEKLLGVVTDPSADRARRIEYAAILGEVERCAAVAPLLEVLGQRESTAPPPVILHSLGRYGADRIGQEVKDLYPNQLRADSQVRTAALELLVSRVQWTRELLTAIEEKRSDPRDIPVQLVRRMQLFDDEAIDHQVDKLWPGVGDKDLAVEKRMAEITVVLREGTGDPSRGERIYMRSCGTCHTLHGQGGDIGPNLTGYDRDNTRYMLLHTLNPNAAIREGYVNYVVKTSDERVLTGVIADRSGGSITLESFGGQVITIPESNIAEMRPLDQSIMPEGLLQPLSDQEIRDLFRFVRTDE